MANFNFKNEKGQILLVVVLAAVISLTVGLSAVSRTITNTKLATDQTNSQRALSAAEAGVEELLKTTTEQNITSPNSSTTKSNFNASATVVGGATNPEILINGNSKVFQHDGADVWLSDYPGYSNPRTGGLKIYWANNDTDCTKNAAIEVALISGVKTDPANLSMKRFVYEPCASRIVGAQGNSFDENALDAPSGGTIQTRNFENSATIPVTSGLIVRIIPLYADAYIGVKGVNGLVLPQQGFLIESVGTSGTSKRKVRVFRGYPKLSVELFPYNIFLP